MADRYEVLWISDEEMDRLVHDQPPLIGPVPQYMSMNSRGFARFWPHLDPQKYTVMLTKR